MVTTRSSSTKQPTNNGSTDANGTAGAKAGASKPSAAPPDANSTDKNINIDQMTTTGKADKFVAQFDKNGRPIAEVKAETHRKSQENVSALLSSSSADEDPEENHNPSSSTSNDTPTTTTNATTSPPNEAPTAAIQGAFSIVLCIVS